MTSPTGYKTTPFADAGVWVSAPAELTVTFTPVEETPSMRKAQDDFEVVRILGNVKFQNATNKGPFKFSPPARLQARFTDSDASIAKGRGKPLVFAWWDGTNWVRFQRGSTVLAPGTPAGGGHGYFDISEIADPPISWGT